MKRKAFTLVELLIVLIIIGVLAAITMISSREIIASSRATKIIADLRSLKTAVVSWYTDNHTRIGYEGDKFYFDGTKYNSIQDAIVGKTTENFRTSGKYVENGISITKYLEGLNEANGIARNGVGVSEKGENAWSYLSDGGYGVNDAGKWERRGTWFVGYRFAENEDIIKQKLKGRAGSLGLIFSKNRPNHGVILDGKSVVSQGGDVTQAKTVWMRVLESHPLDNSD